MHSVLAPHSVSSKMSPQLLARHVFMVKSNVQSLSWKQDSDVAYDVHVESPPLVLVDTVDDCGCCEVVGPVPGVDADMVESCVWV